MNLHIIVDGQRNQFGGGSVFHQPILSNDKTIVTCLEGSDLTNLVAKHPTGIIKIYFAPSQRVPTLQPTFEALSGIDQNRIYVVLPTEEYLSHAGSFPLSRVYGEHSRAHFSLTIAELLKTVAVPAADRLIEKAHLAIANP